MTEPAIAGQVVEAVRDEHALGPTGEVAVESLGRLPSPSAALAKRESEVFFGLAVEGKGGVAGFEGFGRQCGDALELCVAIERFATPHHLVDFAQGQPRSFQPIPHDGGTDWRALIRDGIGDLAGRRVGPEDLGGIGITGGARLQDRFRVFFEWWVGGDISDSTKPQARGRRRRESITSGSVLKMPLCMYGAVCLSSRKLAVRNLPMSPARLVT